MTTNETSIKGSPYIDFVSFTKEQYQQILRMISKENSSEVQGNVASMSFTFNTIDFKNNWILNTGISIHITFNLVWLIDITKPSYGNPATVKLPDGSVSKVQNIGKNYLAQDQIILNVIYISEFKFIILSISQLTHDIPRKVCFFYDFYVMQDVSIGRVKRIGKEKHGL